MLIEVDWSHLEEERDPRWSEQLCLYAYMHPERDWLLYVGKADFSTVRRRLHGDHKARLFRDIRDSYRIDEVRVLHGELIPGSRRRTSTLLADVESLLIIRLAPFGNIQSTASRISRPGMRVHCVGDWPFRRWRFHDVE